MMFGGKEHLQKKQIRYNKIAEMAHFKKKQTMAQVKDILDGILVEEGQVGTKIQQNINYTKNFMSGITENFYTMILEPEFVSLTTEEEIKQKISYFKLKVLQSISPEVISKLIKMENHQKQGTFGVQKVAEQLHMMMVQQYYGAGAQDFEKKIEANPEKMTEKQEEGDFNDKDWILRQWTLKHFEYPYPTTAQTKELSQFSGMSFNEVEGWFQKFRDFEWKSYFPSKND